MILIFPFWMPGCPEPTRNSRKKSHFYIEHLIIMGSKEEEDKSISASGCFFIALILYIGFGLLHTLLFGSIDRYESYGWYSGIWHGSHFPTNWLLGLFTDVPYMSARGSGAYNFFFWVSAIISLILEVLIIAVFFLGSVGCFFPKRETKED